MKIQRKKLLEVLNVLKAGLAQKEIVEQSAYFLFLEDTVISYNDEIALSHPFECGGFLGAVPGKELYDVLLKVKDEEVSFEADKESSELVIQGKKFKASIRFQPDIKLAVEGIKPGRWLTLPANFIEGIKFSLFSVGRDMSSPIHTSIHIEGDRIESTDRFRITSYTIKEAVRKAFLLPAQAAQELIKYTVESYSVTGSWVHFKVGNNCIFSCRIMEGEYPDIQPFLEMGKSHTLRFPNDMKGILERATVALSEDQDQVKISFKEGQLIVKSESSVVRFEETARVRSEKDTLSFTVNPQHLSEILKYTSEAQVDDNMSRLKFVDENFEHVMALSAE